MFIISYGQFWCYTDMLSLDRVMEQTNGGINSDFRISSVVSTFMRSDKTINGVI